MYSSQNEILWVNLLKQKWPLFCHFGLFNPHFLGSNPFLKKSGFAPETHVNILGYSDDVGQEEVKDDQVQEQVLSEELEKIRGLKSKTEVDPEEIYETESLQEPEEVVEEEVQELQEPTAEKLTSELESESSVEE